MALNHARAVAAASTGARIVAIADPSPTARAGLAAVIPGVPEFESLEAMLAAVSPDVVHVCTPPYTHGPLARAALEGGCHVYVEKPFTPTAAEAEGLLELAELRGLRVCAGHQLLYERPARVAEQLTPALGRIVHLESYFSFRTVRRGLSGGAPLRADLQLLDILPHPVYVLLHFLELAGPGRTELASLDVGETGAVHALLRRGPITGHLIVTLAGRPIESYLRAVGTNGSLSADFVRGTTQRLLGPGTSGIDKLLAPYRIAGQLFGGTTAALGRRLLKRQRSYPGLVELFDAFYGSIRRNAASPVSPESIVETVRICEQVAQALAALETRVAVAPRPVRAARVAISGGTGFLGRAVARTLVERGIGVRVLARRTPVAWEMVPGVDYRAVDLGAVVSPDSLAGTEVLIHAAAETSGEWEEHQRNSIDATEGILRAAAAAGVRRMIHVSSLAVLARPRGAPIDESTPLEPDRRGSGPYVWGKLESEHRAIELATELGVAVKIVRPGAIVDYDAFDPPGRLGKRIGPMFVAVGGSRNRLGIVELGFCANVLAWMTERFDEAPDVLNLLAPELPTKRELVERLRRGNPGLTVLWLPWWMLLGLSPPATLLQKILRPGRPAISLQKVFASPSYDNTAVRTLAERIARQVPLNPTAVQSGPGDRPR
jgi:predicted dehydrogenase/nucleoside-diphosphate-sugar epimerase